MGKEFVVDSLEDMCALMCDNNTERLEERKMADIELIIKIPEEVYEKQRYSQYFGAWSVVLQKCFENGTPLPKGHGRLIDADALKKDDEVTEWLSINPIRTGKMLNQFSKLFVKKIDDEPTIIEADKAGE